MLFINNCQIPYNLLFAFNNDSFYRQEIINVSQTRLLAKKVLSIYFLRYSFRKDLVYHKSNKIMLDENIQKLVLRSQKNKFYLGSSIKFKKV